MEDLQREGGIRSRIDDRQSRRSEGNTESDTNANAKGENQNADAKDNKRDEADKSNDSVKSEARDRNENRGGNDDGGNDDPDSSATRREARRQDSASESNETSAKRDESGASTDEGRRSRDLEQRAEDVVLEDEGSASGVSRTNPNVRDIDIPETSTVDLVIEANPDVIASVSTSGGFAFARSGDVIAISGPDGASVIQAEDVESTTPRFNLDEPSDEGGNNDGGFTS